MMSRLTPLSLVTMALCTQFANAQAQARGRASSPPTTRGAASVPANAAPPGTATENPNVTVTALNINRQSVDRILAQTKKAPPTNRGALSGLTNALNKTVAGDKERIEAATAVLRRDALTVSPAGEETVVVVIGSEEDRDKVVASLASVRRVVRVAFVDRSFSDNASDNTVLNAGVAGLATDAATNMWVYLPRTGVRSETPHHTLSTKVAAPALWTGMFTNDGDAIDPSTLRRGVRPAPTTTSTAVAPPATAGSSTGSSTTGGAASAFASGDVVKPKIASVKIYAEAVATSKVVGTVTRADELVVTGPAKDGFLPVEGTSLSGWVSVNLVAK